jgi:hypothetical protein
MITSKRAKSDLQRHATITLQIAAARTGSPRRL